MLNIIWRNPALQAWPKAASVKFVGIDVYGAKVYEHETRTWDFARDDMGATVTPVHFTVTEGGAYSVRLRRRFM